MSVLSQEKRVLVRKPIEGKHLNKSYTVDKKTGEVTEGTATMVMLPAKEGTCAECAVDHKPDQPHNQQSMFYQMKFYNEHGRWPTWEDALAHCSEQVKEMWKIHLRKHGVVI